MAGRNVEEDSEEESSCLESEDQDCIFGVSPETEMKEWAKQKTALGLADDTWLPTRKSPWFKNIFENIPLGTKPDIPLIANFF